ncbi:MULTISPECIES: ImmA/IrrE family metallo-endopeptidase [Streptococcus]|uniref:ImmA/IrrE family metallo-endopeptidase n=1 Tax=Streptococcus TaxID=1301 RepID=UPI000B7BFCDD|nr:MULTISPECIES: ImmA/IrrE family metallo-endopeptidase [Streptococcus]QBX14790.1 hypothetical protein Javan155_0049 [Streptococcus phage Javan155]QBX23673.1 hypothetical protein Javan144_0050 [Streptococcus phage Javan144]ASO68598.1 ImmA/IrrE family metallo-endopeptidase [Streptococcus pyogenes]ASO74313.1 ImmA/IrrE family metallo-endopeptidase [Streptococcus pyogenes]MBM6541860.1 ImmA/IrrE family metallo-endopeptidase [Streptococcus dysgalactiae subsp. equisimilis]
MDLSLQEYVKGHGYELLFYDNRGTDKEAFANHNCKVIGIGSYLDDHEKKKAIYHEIGHKEHTSRQYELNRELCELQADRNMIHHLLKEELSYLDNVNEFNYARFMEKYKLKTIADEKMVIDEYYTLIG